jgi:hypothetical protein
MNLLVRAGLVCWLSLSLLGCGDSYSSLSIHRAPETNVEFRAKEEACKVLLDYAERYEEVFLGKEGPNRENQLSEITKDYQERMSKLAQDGKWTPLQEMGESIKLSFLMGQFQGALQSCQVERAQNDKSLVGCDKVNELKKAMQELCRN